MNKEMLRKLDLTLDDMPDVKYIIDLLVNEYYKFNSINYLYSYINKNLPGLADEVIALALLKIEENSNKKLVKSL